MEFRQVVIYFDNGTFQVFDKRTRQRRTVRKGTYQIEGGSRFVKQVDVVYEARSEEFGDVALKVLHADLEVIV